MQLRIWSSARLRFRTATAVVLALTGALASSAAAQSGTVSIAQSRVIPGPARATTVAAPSIKRIAPTGTCGTTRVCTPAWDLRVVSFTVEDTVVSPTGSVVARLTAENRGKDASQASELRLCVASGSQCVGEAAEVTIPSLQSGERIEIVQPFKSYSSTDVAPPYTALARIDPERVSSEANRANNDASIKIRIEAGSLTIEAVDVVASVQDGASQLPVNVVIRNPSSVSAMPAATLQFRGNCVNRGWGDAATRVAVPALGPGDRWTASINVRHPSAVTYLGYEGQNCKLVVGFVTPTDPNGERSQVERPYNVKRP